jgi:hypothetical protein
MLETSVFGDLSDFPDNYPEATEEDKLQILKCYFTQENYPGFDLVEILSFVRDYDTYIEDRQRAIENGLFDEQRAGRAPRGNDFYLEYRAAYQAIEAIQLLNCMQRRYEQSSVERPELLNWIQQQKTEILEQVQPQGANRLNRFIGFELFGSYRFSLFFQKEIEAIKRIYQQLKFNVIAISHGQWSGFEICLGSARLTIRLGLTLLLPQRLLAAAIRETYYLSNALLRESMQRLFNYVPEGRRLSFASLGIFTGLYVLAGCYMPLPSAQLLLGLQCFPRHWGWDFITKIFEAAIRLQVAAGLSYGVAKWLYHQGALLPQRLEYCASKITEAMAYCTHRVRQWFAREAIEAPDLVAVSDPVQPTFNAASATSALSFPNHYIVNRSRSASVVSQEAMLAELDRASPSLSARG